MPRKVFSGVGYDDTYDDSYEDYEEYGYADDYDYDYEVENNGSASNTITKLEVQKTGVWRCPICTYDNEDDMSACDICGVLRNPLVKIIGQSNTGEVSGTSKDSGVSTMAKSLFTSLPQDMAKKSPLKFDAPYSDDLVSSRSVPGKLKSKGDVLSIRETNALVESELSVKGPDASSTCELPERHNGEGESGNKQDIFDKNVETNSLSSKPRKVDDVTEKKDPSVSKYVPETWMIPGETDDRLSQFNLAIVGHVDSGKSTLSGRLLQLLGQISQKEMHKYEKEAKQQGKGSFAYAWALDESAEERERGITMTVGVAFFTSRRYHVVLLDSPGHKDFVPNMISGATQADAAILVVDASMGSFEAGIDATGGQTREHAHLIRSFGVEQIIVFVNKMDVVEYSKERFDAVKQKLGTVLRTCGFKDSFVIWIPASAIENQNVVANPSDVRLSWFKGPCLLDAIDSLQVPVRSYSKPLLLPICDVLKLQSQGQVSVCGKLESGAIRAGLKVLVMPSRMIATARSLERDSNVCTIARAGDNVTVSLQGIEGNQVKAGGVICHPDYPVQVANHLELKILTLDIPTPIMIGSQLEFHLHHAKEAAKVLKIVSLLDHKTGKVTKKSPRLVMGKQNAIIEVVVAEGVCVEEYSNCRAMGRVFLRSSGRTVALGIVTSIIKREA